MDSSMSSDGVTPASIAAFFSAFSKSSDGSVMVMRGSFVMLLFWFECFWQVGHGCFFRKKSQGHLHLGLMVVDFL